MEAITEQYHSLTRSGKKLADYLFRNSTEAQYLSISVLAERSGVSEASITRFCRGLGLSGYNDFKLALAKSDRITDLNEPTGSPSTIASDDSPEVMFQKLHSANITALNETLEMLDERAVAAAAEILTEAGHVYCVGNGGSMVMAMEAWARFSTASPKFIHIQDSHMQLISIALAGPGDAVLVFSYSGSTKDMEDLLELAHKQNMKIVLITHFPRSVAAKYADVVLQCGYNESPLQSGSVAAKVGQLYLIECLFYSFCRKNPEKLSAARTATTAAIAEKKLL